MLRVLPILLGSTLTLGAAYSLGHISLRRTDSSHVLRLAAGAPLLGLLVFLLLVTGVASGRVLVVVLILLVLALLRWKPAGQPFGRMSWGFGAVVGTFGFIYFIHALAPEIQPDGYTYHLGLVREWLNLGRFPDRIGFYETLPQGLEMLFLPAFAIGRHSAAKLVHFAFLLATVPLLFLAARKLGLSDRVAAVAAALYFCAPVVGISGTATYNDAALVFFVLATFCFLLAWEDRRDHRYLLAAGLTAGFCYAVKFTGLVVAPAALAFLVWRRQWRACVFLAAGAALIICPWMVRNAIWTGNPIAPLFNSIFPNPHFHVTMERHLATSLRTYGGVTPGTLPIELTIRGRGLQGLIGPVFLLAPLGLVALRRRAGRIVLLAAGVVALPWMFNIGARFLMPALVFLSLALAIALPRRIAPAVAGFHAVLCLPPVVALYADPYAWTLKGLPWRAALRLEDEPDYLRERLWPYRVAELVQNNVPAGARIFDLTGAASAYFDAVAIGPWQSAAADRMTAALRTAAAGDRLTELSAEWPRQRVMALRFRPTHTEGQPWSLQEVELKDGAVTVIADPTWQLWARPNVWEAPLAFDGNLMTRWSTWEPADSDSCLQVRFSQPRLLAGASLFILGPERQSDVEVSGQGQDGQWRLLSGTPRVVPWPALDLRRSATLVLAREGIQYVLAPVANLAYAWLGKDLAENADDWGLEVVGAAHGVCLLRLRPDEGTATGG